MSKDSKKAALLLSSRSMEPVFQLRTVALFAGVEPSKVLDWIHRGLVTLKALRNPGKGNVRLYSFRETLQIVAMARISQAYGIMPSALYQLSQDVAIELVFGISETWAKEALEALDGSELPREFAETLNVPGFLVWRGLLPSSKQRAAAGGDENRIQEAFDSQSLVFRGAEDMAKTLPDVSREMESWCFLTLNLSDWSRYVLRPGFQLWWAALHPPAKGRHRGRGAFAPVVGRTPQQPQDV